ncbi:EpsG family protein [Flavobacterium sp. LS1R49]|uniref:EpsG family protein n=1 Tax=Flavobacterium shii TaxID=2987687 RepID=A0A9X3BY61_9FLAO|nr:EpsG family protein [Flavobacterium shii]MCV9927431.1 EpsG family protein [Flavobacterium shii]
MAIYIFIFILFFLFSYLEIRTSIEASQKNVLYIILYSFLVLLVGFRWETGTDWNQYLKNFTNSTSIDTIIVNILLGFEIGYGLFTFFIRSLTDNYTVFLVIHAILYYFLIFRANKQLSPFPFVSLLVFYVSTMGILGSNRQLIALAICLFSLKFVLEKKAFKFFLCVLIAFLFHTSALLFIVYYFLNRHFSKVFIILVLLGAIIIGKSSLPGMLFSNIASLLGGASASKVDIYSENVVSETSLSLVGLIRRILFFILFFVNYKILSIKFLPYKLLFNGFFLGLVIYFLFSSSFIALAGRGSFYFNVMECFLLSSQLLLFKSKRDRAYLLLIFFVYSYLIFFQSISEYPELFIPYKGVFINTDYFREY